MTVLPLLLPTATASPTALIWPRASTSRSWRSSAVCGRSTATTPAWRTEGKNPLADRLQGTHHPGGPVHVQRNPFPHAGPERRELAPKHCSSSPARMPRPAGTSTPRWPPCTIPTTRRTSKSVRQVRGTGICLSLFYIRHFGLRLASNDLYR